MCRDRKIIEKWLAKNDFSMTEKQVDLSCRYLELVRTVSGKMNLVSRNDLGKLAERHFLDSLNALLVYRFSEKSKVADIGSGAGFPGIPIAIARPDLSIHLVESRRRKALFLNQSVSELDLKNVSVINDRWENISHEYNIALIRAVYPQSELEEKVLSLLPTGAVLLYFAKYNNVIALRKI